MEPRPNSSTPGPATSLAIPDQGKRDGLNHSTEQQQTRCGTTGDSSGGARNNQKNVCSGQGFYSISENLGFKFGGAGSGDCVVENGFENGGGFMENGSARVNCDKLGDNIHNDNDDDDGDKSIDEDETLVDGGDFLTSGHVSNLNKVNNKTRIIPRYQISAPKHNDSLESILLSPRENYPSSVKSSPPFALNNNNNIINTINCKPPSAICVSTLNLNLNLPVLRETVTHGFGLKMVASSSCQQLIYRSVPPRPLSYTLTDVLESKSSNQRSKTAPVSVNTPEDYAQRFKSRPTTRPRVIEFDGSAVTNKGKKMAMNSGFPTSRAKIYIGHPKTAPSPTQSYTSRSGGSKIQLAPLEHTGRRSTPGFAPGSSRTVRTIDKTVSHHGNQTTVTRATTKSACSSVPDQGTKSTVSVKPSVTTKETIPSAEFTMSVPRAPTPDPEDHIHNPELLLTSSTECDDLSILPRPKKVLPKRELPWVFRYKVKKGMNTLSRIMASKPAPNILHSSYTFT